MASARRDGRSPESIRRRKACDVRAVEVPPPPTNAATSTADAGRSDGSTARHHLITACIVTSRSDSADSDSRAVAGSRALRSSGSDRRAGRSGALQHKPQRCVGSFRRRLAVNLFRLPYTPACRRVHSRRRRRLSPPARSPGSSHGRRVDHDVRRLDVAVENAALVRGRDAGADLPRDVARLWRRTPPGRCRYAVSVWPSMNSIDR